MRFLMMIKASKQSEAGAMPSEAAIARMMKYNEELSKAGVLLDIAGLHPSSKGARVQFRGTTVTVVDGPFTESKELIAGYWLIQVKSKEEAIAWMQRAPFGEGTVLEIRQVFEAADFAPSDPTGEHRAKEAELRASAASRQG